ncbi:MAG: hypothetical protein ACW98D_16705 [Promethearchaeota archaeon]|jgi:hypothetical protein
MFEQSSEALQYIASLKGQLKSLKSQLEDLGNTPRFVRLRKGMEEQYLSMQSQKEALIEKINVANTRAEELMAMEEAQGSGMRLGESIQRNIKLIAVGSGVLLVAVIIGAVIYKKVKK